MVKSYFIPDTCIQGAGLPVHLIWDSEKKLKITLHFPSNLLTPKEIYNVTESGLEFLNGTLSMKEFERNGYLGCLFKTVVYDEYSVESLMRIVIESEEGIKEIIEKNILLFRTDIVLDRMPDIIRIRAAAHETKIDNKILLLNKGLGTALVKLDVSSESDVSVITSNSIHEFVNKFAAYLLKRTEYLEKQFPDESNLIHDYVTLIVRVSNGQIDMTQEELTRIDKIMEEIYDACMKNEALVEAIMELLVGAYLASVSVISELQSFLEYLKSLAGHKIILVDSMRTLVLKPGVNNFIARLNVTDLNHNFYAPIDIDVKLELESTEGVSMPLYSIIEFGGKEQ